MVVVVVMIVGAYGLLQRRYGMVWHMQRVGERRAWTGE